MHTLITTADLWGFLNNWPETKVRAFEPHWVMLGPNTDDWAPARAVAKLASLGVLVRKGDDEWYSYRPIPMKGKSFAKRSFAGGWLGNKAHIVDWAFTQYWFLCSRRGVSRITNCDFNPADLCHKCVKIAMRDAR